MKFLTALLLSCLCAAASHAGPFEDGVRDLNARDYSNAESALRAAAAGGNAMAERFIGFMYYRGTGVAQSNAEAVRWFERAASHGDLESQLNLGQMYENGLSVAQNDGQSARWYGMAAEQGDRRAQLRVGEIYYLGAGVPQDRAEAVKWWQLATRIDDAQTVRMRAMIDSSLKKVPPEVRAEGLRRAQVWLAAP